MIFLYYMLQYLYYFVANPLFEDAANNYITVIKLRMIRIHREQIKRT